MGMGSYNNLCDKFSHSVINTIVAHLLAFIIFSPATTALLQSLIYVVVIIFS